MTAKAKRGSGQHRAPQPVRPGSLSTPSPFRGMPDSVGGYTVDRGVAGGGGVCGQSPLPPRVDSLAGPSLSRALFDGRRIGWQLL